ncbi:unnamed protein product [Adineta ricciae]|uniref:Uncharacterized protein n=1 Tax=Adineta ricciae TaxID=249248 RepID=A0A815X5P6_ADIRI|nr:unnamed protein product [Adineta ricciae]
MSNSTSQTASSSSSNTGVKRSAAFDLDEQTKKMKIETPTLERKCSVQPVAKNIPTNFVSARTLMNAPIPEISDEELLVFTLEFERVNWHLLIDLLNKHHTYVYS